MKAEHMMIGELLTPPQFKKVQIMLSNIDVPERMQVLANMLALMPEPKDKPNHDKL